MITLDDALTNVIALGFDTAPIIGCLPLGAETHEL